VIVSSHVGLFKLIVKKLTMVNTKSSVLASHADNFVDHVETGFGEGRPCVDVRDHFSGRFVRLVPKLKLSPARSTSHLSGLFTVKGLVDVVFGLEQSVEVFVYDRVLSVIASGHGSLSYRGLRGSLWLSPSHIKIK
jgi:hypothetical protein